MIWAFMIYLGADMWNEADSLRRFNKNDPKFYDTLYTSRDAWRKVTDYAVEAGFNTLLVDIGEGLRFDSHPEIAAKGAWTKEEMKAEIDRLNAKGMTVIPKLNFASIHDAWLGKYSHMLSTPIYYKVVKDLIEEAIELFQPPLFHLGFDEESRREKHMQNTYGYSSLRYGELYDYDLNYCVKCVTDKGVRPWLWGGLVHFHKDDFLKATTREAVISTYNYGLNRNIPASAPDYIHDVQNAASVLEKYGYDQIPTTSTCYEYYSIDDSIDNWRRIVSKKHLLGYLTAPWCRTGDDDVYSLMAEAKIFKAARNKYYPEEAVK